MATGGRGRPFESRGHPGEGVVRIEEEVARKGDVDEGVAVDLAVDDDELSTGNLVLTMHGAHCLSPAGPTPPERQNPRARKVVSSAINSARSVCDRSETPPGRGEQVRPAPARRRGRRPGTSTVQPLGRFYQATGHARV